MQEHGWNLQDYTAIMRGTLQNPDGTTLNIILSARWENDPGPILAQVRENVGDRQVPGIDLLGENFNQGFYVRVVIEGRPTAILSVPTPPELHRNITRFAQVNPAGEFIRKIIQENPNLPQGKPPPEYPDIPMSTRVDTMLTWPESPTRQTLDSAQEFIQQNINDQDDLAETIATLRESDAVNHTAAANLLELQVNKVFSRWGTDMFRETLNQQGMENKDRIEEEIASCGDSPHTIGAGIQLPAAHGIIHIFTRVLRSQDWMGFCPAWPNVNGASALVLESQGQPGRPGIILAGPHRTPRPGATTHFPEGEPQRLRQILEWHGPASCVWVPGA